MIIFPVLQLAIVRWYKSNFRYGCKLVEFEWVGLISNSVYENSSWVELMKYFELKNLAQIRLVTIQASSRTGSRANTYTLTSFNI
jgi:hypothetical protein